MISRAKVLLKLVRTPESIGCKCLESTDAKSYTHLFIDSKVQKLLKKLTNINLETVFKVRPTGEPLRAPDYKLMTTQELNLEMKKIQAKADVLLQMPPVLEPKSEINEVLSVDPGLDGFDQHHSKYVFTDISFDLKNEERIIVVREPNGILRKAKWNERHRMNQVYFPIKGRELEVPQMFKEEHLKEVLDREEYKFILDRACIQFEPDDPEYINVTTMTYDIINKKSHFSKLHSTRHFGSMTFYLIVNKNIDNLLLDIIKSERIDDAYTLIELYHLIHPDCQSAKLEKNTNLETLENYIKLDSTNQNELELALQTFLAKYDKKKEAAAQ